MTRCEIDLDKMKRNIDRFRQLISPGVKIMSIIKADAYGHGAAVLMKHMLRYGVEYFGVASLNEGLELRETNKEGHILVLGVTPDHLLHYCPENNLMQTVMSYRQAKILSDCAAGGKKAKIHIKFDSGMHRLGFQLTGEAVEEVAAIAKLPGVEICGIFTHLSLACRESDEAQYQRFLQFIRLCEARGVRFPIKHACDGNGTIFYPHMHMDMVRPGAFFYGFNKSDLVLEPIMEMKSVVGHVFPVPAGDGVGYGLLEPENRDRVIATLPFGYIDGVPRALSYHRGWVGIRGQKAPIVGVMCMDMCMVDVTDISGVQEGDEVVIFSESGGGMSYQEAADMADFNRNGLQAACPRRVPKVYFENGRVVDMTDYLLD